MIEKQRSNPTEDQPLGAGGSATLLLIAALSGALLMALEILASRILAPHFGNSVYVWGSIISVFLAAMSIGYSWGGRMADRHPERRVLGRLILIAAVWLLALRLWSGEVAGAVGDATGATPMGTLIACLLLFGIPGVLFGMVSPFVIRLAADDLTRLGKTSGRIFALSTVGSLAGTLLCTFFAIPRFPVPTILATLTLGTAVTASVALSRQSMREAALALLVGVAVLTTGGGYEKSSEEVVAVRGTAYQTLEVLDRAGVRYLRSDRVTQGAIWLDSGKAFSRYVGYAPAMFLTTPNAKKALAIGMGGGLLSQGWRRAVPEIEIDYAELDPAIPEVAERYGFWQPHPADRVHVGDGRRFLVQSDERWDLIYLDAYIGRSIPFHLTTREFFAIAREHLTEGGSLALNLAAGLEDPFSRSVVHTLRRSFRTTLIFGVRGTGNVLVIGTDQVQPSSAALLERARSFSQPDVRERLIEVVERLVDWAYEGTEVVELHDDFAPADHLVALGDRDFDLELLAPGTKR